MESMVMENMNQAVDAKIEDPIQGVKFCHQCRQKRMDAVGTCVTKKRTTMCPVKICPKCLWNRYGETADEVASKVDWQCHKCRGICNCSICMKNRGEKPIGRTPKESGCSNVSELLKPENSAQENHVAGKEPEKDKRQELKDSSADCMEESTAVKRSTDSITFLKDSTSLHKYLVSSKDGIRDVGSSRYVAHNDVVQHPQVMRSFEYNKPPSGVLKVNGEKVSLPSHGYKKPSGFLKVKGEHVAVTALKRQLGRQYRADGPPLGVEFDPLPPGAFEPQNNVIFEGGS